MRLSMPNFCTHLYAWRVKHLHRDFPAGKPRISNLHNLCPCVYFCFKHIIHRETNECVTFIKGGLMTYFGRSWLENGNFNSETCPQSYLEHGRCFKYLEQSRNSLRSNRITFIDSFNHWIDSTYRESRWPTPLYSILIIDGDIISETYICRLKLDGSIHTYVRHNLWFEIIISQVLTCSQSTCFNRYMIILIL